MGELCILEGGYTAREKKKPVTVSLKSSISDTCFWLDVFSLGTAHCWLAGWHWAVVQY